MKENLTIAELDKRVIKEYTFMDKDEKYLRLTYNDPTFQEYVLSCLRKLNKNTKIWIDTVNLCYGII